MIIKYNKCNFENIKLRQVASTVYQILKTKNHELAKHVWGELEILYPLERSNDIQGGINEGYGNDELYNYSKGGGVGLHKWYPISYLPNMMMRQIGKNLGAYQIRKVGNIYFWEIVFNFQRQEAVDGKHKEIGEEFGKLVDIKGREVNHCLVFSVSIEDYSDDNLAKFLAEKAIEFYDKYNNTLIKVLEKFAPKYIERCGYIYE